MLGLMAGTGEKDSHVYIPVMTQRPFSMVQTVLRTLVIPQVAVRCQVVDVLFVLVLQVSQVHFLGKVIDVPVVCNVRCWP